MKISKKLCNKLLLSVGLSCLLLFSCDKQDSNFKKNENPVARINDTLFTIPELKKLMNDSAWTKTKKEYIKQMIDREVLFLAAGEDTVFSSEKYKRLISNAARDIASSLFVENYFKTNSAEITEKEIFEFYNQNKEEFKCHSLAFYYNIALLNTPEKANEFSNALTQMTWSSAIKRFKENTVYSEEKLFNNDFEIDNIIIKRILENLSSGEISIVIEGEQDSYYVVQLIEKYRKNEIPSMVAIQSNVKERLQMIKSKQVYEALLQDLYKKYKVELIKD